MRSSNQSIGLFDSGVGGFSVVKAIQKILPYENLVYFGDTARMPYGNKSKDAIIRYSLENAYFLQQHNIKLLIVACNTASVHALDTLKSTLDIPVVSITDEVFQETLQSTQSKLGILGTKSTVTSGFFEKAFLELDPALDITSIACPMFATLVEEGLENHPATYLLAKEYLAPLFQKRINTVLLACTHYPFLLNLFRDLCGDDILFIDPALSCAKKTKKILQDSELLNMQKTKGSLNIYASNDEASLKIHANRFLKDSLKNHSLISSVI